MDRQYIVSIIEKYYLNGLIERTKINIKNNNIEVKFINDNKNLTGIIDAENIKLEDSELGIYDTTQLLKLIAILDNSIEINFSKTNNIIQKLLIFDNEYNLEYPLANVNILPKPPIIDEPTYGIEFDINKEFIQKFIKAYKALKVSTLIIDTYYDENSNGKIKFTIGENTNFSNKIDFEIIGNIGVPCSSILFPIEEISLILINNNDLKEGKGYISEQGLMKLKFTNKDNIKSTYILVGKE